MKDKQIIIDGVDVSGCKYYLFREQQPNGERCCGMGLVDCNGNDCLYKKYKRKEQEYEELKKMLKDLSCENQKFCYQIEKLTNKLSSKKIEYEMLELLNKQLEHQLKPFRDEYFRGLDNVAIAELAKKSIRITAENSKLEQTLTEIKEIAITGLEGFCPKCSRKECEDNNCIETAIRDILQKISECEGNDEKV